MGKQGAGCWAMAGIYMGTLALMAQSNTKTTMCYFNLAYRLLTLMATNVQSKMMLLLIRISHTQSKVSVKYICFALDCIKNNIVEALVLEIRRFL
jgi:hypothetical protein